MENEVSEVLLLESGYVVLFPLDLGNWGELWGGGLHQQRHSRLQSNEHCDGSRVVFSLYVEHCRLFGHSRLAGRLFLPRLNPFIPESSAFTVRM